MSRQAKKTLKFENHVASKALNIIPKPKKQDEEQVIHGFLSRIGLKKVGVLPRERPDFLVLTNGGIKISSEITRYYSDGGKRGSIEQRFFRLWTDFAVALKKRLSAERLDHLYGTIHFREPNRKEIPESKAFIDEIVTALRSHRNRVVISGFDPANFPILARHVDHIYMEDTSPERGILWWCAHLQSGEVEGSSELLWEQAETKDQEAGSYNWPECDERWLVIYAAARGLADFAPTIKPSNRPLKVTNFDRVFLCDAFFEKVHQLFPSVATLFDAESIYVNRLPHFLKMSNRRIAGGSAGKNVGR
jgi:hypothetical protein